LILRPSDGTESRVILVASTETPFKVASVNGVLLAEAVAIPLNTARVHRLNLILDPRKSADLSASDIQIETDHPDQRRLAISVLLLPRLGGTDQ